MCQSDMLNMPELLAVRGRPDGPDMEESDGRYDGYSSNQEEVPSVPYFHISSAQPGGTAAADSGFAAKCRLFSIEEAKRDPSGYDLVEFPSAWSRRFRKVSDPGKTYWIRVLENRISDGFLTTPDKEETKQDFITPSKEQLITEQMDTEHGQAQFTQVSDNDTQTARQLMASRQTIQSVSTAVTRNQPKEYTSTKQKQVITIEIEKDNTRKKSSLCSSISTVCCLFILLLTSLALAFFFLGANITITRVQEIADPQCSSPKLTNPPNQGNRTNPGTYYYTGEPVVFQVQPFEVEPASCVVSYECSMSQLSIVDLCNYSKGTTNSHFDPETGVFFFESNDISNFGSQTLSFTITASSGDASAETSFQLELVNPCFIAELDIDTKIIADEIEYDIYESNTALHVDIDSSRVTLKPDYLQSAISLCGKVDLNIVRNDRSNILRRLDRVFSFIQTPDESKLVIDTQDFEDAGSYEFLLLASFRDKQYSQMSKKKFQINLTDYCAGSTISDPSQAPVTSPEIYRYEGTATYTPVPYQSRPSQCRVKYACRSSVPGLCNTSTEDTLSTFNPQTGEFSFSSVDMRDLNQL